MVLEQDKAQASQAQVIIAEQQYQKDLAEYEKDLAEYEKQKAEYEKQQKKIADAMLKEQTRIAEEKRKEKEKADKRAAQFAKVQKVYEEKVEKNPYTEQAKSENPTFRHYVSQGIAYKFNYNWEKQSQNYLKQAQQAKREAEKDIRYQHFREDGFEFASAGALQRDAAQLLGDINRGKGIGYRKISDRGYKQVQLVLAREQLLYGEITKDQYNKKVGRAKSVYKAQEQRAAEERSKQARAKVAGYLAADAKHWENVASGNYDAKYPSEQKPTINTTRTDDLTVTNNLKELGVDTSKTKVETKDHGYYTETILRAVDVNKSGTTLNNAAEISRYVSVSNETFKVPETPTAPKIPVRTNTSSRKGVNEANILQKQYVQDVRDGKVNLYQALTKPRTPQLVSKNNTINLNRYLTERGYDVTKPETIPDSVLMTPQKYDLARKEASYAKRTDTPMGDLRKFIPRQPQVSDNVIQQRKETMEKYAVDKGGSFVGYGPDGTPMQGAPFLKTEYQVALSDGTVRTFETEKEAEKFAQSKSITKFDVTYSEPTSIPTIYGDVITYQEPVTYTFDSEQEAQAFIDKRQASLPYTQDAKILPLEKMYSDYDQFAKEAYKRAEDHPSSWIYQGGAAWTSFGGDLLNLATMGGDLLDKYVFKRPTIPKQPITTIPTYYDKGFEEATKGIEITDTGVTGITPSLINPLDEGNVVSKWYQGAAKQWDKQTPAQNIGQSWVFVPVTVIDAVSAGQAGTSFVRRVAPGVKSLATKITSTPAIVTRVVEASSVSTRTIPVKPTYANYNINTIANPDRIDLDFKGVDYMDSPKPPGINLQSKAFEEDLASRGIKPVDQVKLDPEYSPDRIDLDFKGVDFMVSPKPPTLNLKSKAFQEDLTRRPPTGAGEYGAERFRQFQENVSPSINIVGRIKFSKGFIPGKPTRQYTPFKPKEVEEEPFFKQDKINKKKIFDDDDKPAGWETKPVEGRLGTGTTTVQLVKSETKKQLKTSQKLIQDKKNPTPVPRDFTKLESERTLPKTGSSPLKLVPIPRGKRKRKQTETITSSTTVSEIQTTTLRSQTVSASTSTQTVSGIVSAQKIRPTQKSRSVTRTSQPLVQSVPQKVSATPKPKQALRSSPQPRPRLRSRPKFRFRTRVRPIQSQPEPIPGRARTIAGFAPPSEKRKEEEKKSKNRKRKEFLGNTRLDKIEGLFRRSEIVSGDKRVAKQVKLDKAFKENKPKTRRKRKKESFGQKMGIVKKGFKI